MSCHITLMFVDSDEALQGYSKYESRSGDVPRFVRWNRADYKLDRLMQTGLPVYCLLQLPHNIRADAFREIEEDSNDKRPT